MTLAPFLAAPPLVQAHALAAVAALALGTVQFAGRKGTARHRMFGWIWIVLMVAVALSSFGIADFRQFGPFSAIHGLSILVLLLLPRAVLRARARRIESHRWSMIGLYVGALLVAGAFTLTPGRIMQRVLFGPAPIAVEPGSLPR